ncbi:DinB family protein [Aquimarina gracilis]|uniref:DinB family protein n=1 Tax=Aquimarina gracilis TaxID=874422 RepID=A0ABU5ZT68_9FLAO|nr:DinB family protein [Aquimarina gracilis]MEB3344762.1 DinB family protein [Aquimarina gracilis]
MKYTPSHGFLYYFTLIKEKDLQTLYNAMSTFDFIKSIPEEKAGHRYEPDKWSIKQIIGHITDHERIKMFRAFQLSRNEDVELWGYNQNFLVNQSRFDDLKIKLLIDDFQNVRKASISFIRTLSAHQLKKKGWAREHEITLKDFLISIIGHERHHINIIKEKYL